MLVVGASGSGKSTLGRIIAGLIPGDVPGELRGTIEIDGLDLAAASRAEIAARVGIVFQDPGSQLVMERVEDDVAFGLENRAWPPATMRARVPEVLAQVGLAGMERRRSNVLSGGQQQRLALAGVLAARPGILVLDEPTANLDPAGTAAVFEILAEIRERRLATIVLIEHRVDAAWPLADRLLALGRDGSPIDAGTPEEVIARSGSRLRDEGIWLPAAVEASLPPREAAPLTRLEAWLTAQDARSGQAEPPTGAEPSISAGPSTGAASSPAPEDPADGRGGPAVHVPDARWPLAAASRLTFGYEPGLPVVRDVDLVVDAGERVALVGPNGSGKSTLGRLLVGLLRASHGTVRLAGRDPSRLPPGLLAREAGYIFQDPDLGFLEARVIDEVTAGLPRNRHADAEEMLQRLGLPPAEFALRSPYRLSGGEARRLSLAAALVRNPALLVLDEPTYGQDRRGYEALLEILRERISAGAAVIAATHDERLVADFAARRVEMADGWIVADEATEPGPGSPGLAAPSLTRGQGA